jgi:hypothetical protein
VQLCPGRCPVWWGCSYTQSHYARFPVVYGGGKNAHLYTNMEPFRATSNTSLRAHDHYTSSTLIGGKGGAGPSSLHTTLEGPTEYVNARWMESLHELLHNIEWIMYHGHLDYFHKPSLGGRPNTKPRDHSTPNTPILLIYSILSRVRTRMNRNSLK